MTLKKKPFENIEGKGENAGSQHFSLFPTMFSTLPQQNFNFSSANAFNLDQFKLLSLSKVYPVPKEKNLHSQN